jgi:hypothetical protein
MTQMDAAVGIGQCGGDENFALGHGCVPDSESGAILANRAHWRRIGY